METMETQDSLVLTQYRNEGNYNDFIGKFYHFPSNSLKSYLSQFDNLPIEFIYYEPLKNGEGEFYGYGKIIKKPFEDKREAGFCFVEIEDYKEFSKPVYFKDLNGEIIENLSPNYNPQNAVRKIPHHLLDEMCLDGGIILNIESDAHLIQVLGEQLIGSEKVGILELIKNSIDAQASYCRVRIEKVPTLKNIDSNEYEFPNLEGPIIIIEDNGIGMTKEVIQNGWLRPASTLKTNIKEQLKKERENALLSGSLASYDVLYKQLQKEHGRIPLGEKGVGRFATHRLGRYLELRTKINENDYEYVLKIDWSKFDQVSSSFINLNSIGIGLFREPISRDYGERNSGTKLIIYGGKDGFEWDEQIIQDLNSSILNLNSPYSLNKFDKKAQVFKSFNAILECPQIENLKSEQIYSESTPNFSLDALVNEYGFVDYELKFKHPNDTIPKNEWKGQDIDLRLPDDNKDKLFDFWYDGNEKRKPECGGFFIHLDVWYRKSEWIDLSNHNELISYLDNYGGISIYRDGILILDSKLGSQFDWLGLSKKHIKQGFRISYRDMVGNIEIDQKSNFNLIDKTNREGLIENQASKDLAALSTTIIEKILFPKYRSKRDEFSQLTKGLITDPKTITQLAKAGESFFSNVAENGYPIENDPYKFFNNLWEKVDERRAGIVNLRDSMKKLQESVKLLEDVQDIFVEQAGFGISVAISLHEINKITSNFYNGISQIIKSGDFDRIKLEDLQNTSMSLRSELNRLSPLRAIRNEINIDFNILKSIKYASEVYKRKMDKEGIHFEVLNPEDDFDLYGRYSTINQVFGNLFDNSIYWIKYSGGGGEKQIKILLNKEYRTVIFGDTGSDISKIIRPNLFQPGYSLKNPPSGLGLFICKTYLNNMDGRIYETPTKDRIPNTKGAHFTLDFKKTSQKRQL